MRRWSVVLLVALVAIVAFGVPALNDDAPAREPLGRKPNRPTTTTTVRPTTTTTTVPAPPPPTVDPPPLSPGAWMTMVHQSNDAGGPTGNGAQARIDQYGAWLGLPVNNARQFFTPLMFGSGATYWPAQWTRYALERWNAWADAAPGRTLSAVIAPGFTANYSGGVADNATLMAVVNGTYDNDIRQMVAAFTEEGLSAQIIAVLYHEADLRGGYLWQWANRSLWRAAVMHVIDVVRSQPGGDQWRWALPWDGGYSMPHTDGVTSALPPPDYYDFLVPDYYGYDTARTNAVLADMKAAGAYVDSLGPAGAHLRFFYGEGGIWNPTWGTPAEHQAFIDAVFDQFDADPRWVGFSLFDVAPGGETDHKFSPPSHYPAETVDRWVARSLAAAG